MTGDRLDGSVCERCGATFYCGAREGSCWCAEVEISEVARSELAAAYRSCLCPACLRQLAVATLDRDPIS